MTGRDGRVRRLDVDGTVWHWTVRHRHPPCVETLSLYRAEPRRTLRLAFRAGPGRVVPAGHPEQSGHVELAGGPWANLHLPGTVRLLFDTVTRQGLLPDGPTERELDGWEVLACLPADFDPDSPLPS